GQTYDATTKALSDALKSLKDFLQSTTSLTPTSSPLSMTSLEDSLNALQTAILNQADAQGLSADNITASFTDNTVILSDTASPDVNPTVNYSLSSSDAPSMSATSPDG